MKKVKVNAEATATTNNTITYKITPFWAMESNKFIVNSAILIEENNISLGIYYKNAIKQIFFRIIIECDDTFYKFLKSKEKQIKKHWSGKKIFFDNDTLLVIEDKYYDTIQINCKKVYDNW